MINKPKVIKEKLEKIEGLNLEEKVQDLEEIIVDKETKLNQRKDKLKIDE